MGEVASSNSYFDGDLEQLSSTDFKVVANFDADALFTSSAIYFDSVDGEVWYVEYDEYGDEGSSEVYLMATLDGVTQLRASDIVLVDHYSD